MHASSQAVVDNRASPTGPVRVPIQTEPPTGALAIDLLRVRLYELVVTHDIEEEDSPVEGGGCVHDQDDGEQSCDMEVLQGSSPRI